MPTNKNALERYFIIDELLSNHYHNYTVEDIREECENRLRDKDPNYEIGVRQIQKDIKFLSEEGPFFADIEEYYFDGENKNGRVIKKRGVRYKKPSFSIFKKELSENQKRLLSEVFTVMGQFDGIPGLDALNDLKGELKINDSNRIVEFSRNPIENTTHFGKLFMAIANKQVVNLHYHVFQHPEDKKAVLVHPYLLKEYNRKWYLLCGADDTGNVLTFVLDERLEDIEPRPELLYKECKEDLADRFDEIVVGIVKMQQNNNGRNGGCSQDYQKNVPPKINIDPVDIDLNADKAYRIVLAVKDHVISVQHVAIRVRVTIQRTCVALAALYGLL